MFKWLKNSKSKSKSKNKNTSVLVEDYEQDIPIQYSKVDLDITLDNVKHYYYGINEQNKRILKDFIKMADYFREWLIESTLFKEDDIKISYEFRHNSIVNPKVDLEISLSENEKETVSMEFGEKYKRNIRILADVVYKKMCECQNESQKIYKELKDKLDAIAKEKIK